MVSSPYATHMFTMYIQQKKCYTIHPLQPPCLKTQREAYNRPKWRSASDYAAGKCRGIMRAVPNLRERGEMRKAGGRPREEDVLMCHKDRTAAAIRRIPGV